VLCADAASPAAMASLDAASSNGRHLDPPIVVGPGGPTFGEVLDSVTAEYVAVLQAGEVLAAHALSVLAWQIVKLGRPVALYADEDQIGPDGVRRAPLFKPPPSRTLMLSGTLCTGVWLIRRTHLAAFSPDSDAWAETVRLDAWLRLHEGGEATASCRVPFVLTHRRPDTEIAPPDALAAVAAAHIARTGLPAMIVAERPLRLRLTASRSSQKRVTIVVPSACRARHVTRYVGATLAGTEYGDYELIVVVAGPPPLDETQREVLAQLEADPRVRRLIVEADRFNYSIANNRAVAASDSPLVCLLNDDVAPCHSGWLDAMVGHLADPAVGVVGARLNYPDRTIQHAGILLMPDGTGEHPHRHLDSRAPGFGWRAQLSQEVSAVTGACLLTRREIWDRLEGLDEDYVSAFSDVDFCLRAREAGFGIVLAGDVELTHAESVTYGLHYGPDESARNAADRIRLRTRFPDAFREDPFHNPNLSLRRRNFHGPAFPPRVTMPPL
jgi:GT2 family glycosyltransferase